MILIFTVTLISFECSMRRTQWSKSIWGNTWTHRNNLSKRRVNFAYDTTGDTSPFYRNVIAWWLTPGGQKDFPSTLRLEGDIRLSLNGLQIFVPVFEAPWGRWIVEFLTCSALNKAATGSIQLHYNALKLLVKEITALHSLEPLNVSGTAQVWMPFAIQASGPTSERRKASRSFAYIVTKVKPRKPMVDSSYSRPTKQLKLIWRDLCPLFRSYVHQNNCSSSLEAVTICWWRSALPTKLFRRRTPPALHIKLVLAFDDFQWTVLHLLDLIIHAFVVFNSKQLTSKTNLAKAQWPWGNLSD